MSLPTLTLIVTASSGYSSALPMRKSVGTRVGLTSLTSGLADSFSACAQFAMTASSPSNLSTNLW